MCMLSNINKMAYFYTAYTVHVTIFSTGRNSDQFRILCSYTLLIYSFPFSWLG